MKRINDNLIQFFIGFSLCIITALYIIKSYFFTAGLLIFLNALIMKLIQNNEFWWYNKKYNYDKNYN